MKDKGIKDNHIFEHGAVSGITLAKRRNGFRKLLQFIDKDADSVDRLYIFELSRLGRSFLETLELFKEFETKGIKVISLSLKAGHRWKTLASGSCLFPFLCGSLTRNGSTWLGKISP